jgi:hypothetical protein
MREIFPAVLSADESLIESGSITPGAALKL